LPNSFLSPEPRWRKYRKISCGHPLPHDLQNLPFVQPASMSSRRTGLNGCSRIKASTPSPALALTTLFGPCIADAATAWRGSSPFHRQRETKVVLPGLLVPTSSLSRQCGEPDPNVNSAIWRFVGFFF